MSENKTKQVIVLRKDLGMRKGKMVAQGAHASMKAILDQAFSLNQQYVDGAHITIPCERPMFEWITGIFTKVCVSVDSEEELLEIYNKADAACIPCSLIQDAGLTEFDGVPTYTAVAVGPAYNEDVDEITSHLTLL